MKKFLHFKKKGILSFFYFIFLISTPLLLAKTPSDLYLTSSSVQNNPFFVMASRNKGNKAFREKIEIAYLIEVVRRSSLSFIRNGETHSASEAAAHLLWKYLQAGGRVKTTHDFIDGIASQSIQTGSRYWVKIPSGKTYLLRDVLYNELQRLEQSLKEK